MLKVKGIVGVFILVFGSLAMLSLVLDMPFPEYVCDEFTNVVSRTEAKDPMELYHAFQDTSSSESNTTDYLEMLCQHTRGSLRGESAILDFDFRDLEQLAKERKEDLFRYLATNPAWRFHKVEFGGVIAERRFMRGGEWYDDGSGCCGVERGELRVFIAFGVKWLPWTGYCGAENKVKSYAVGTKAHVASTKWGDRFVSQIAVNGKGWIVGLEECQSCSDCRYISAVIAALRHEFGRLAKAATWNDVCACLPGKSRRYGKPSLEVYYCGIGTYQYRAYVNPSEPGFVYVRVADPKSGRHYWMTETHRPPIKQRTNEYVGWSSLTNELYFASRQFTMYNGEYGKPAPVNVELWFSPQSGGRDRKLSEQIFNLEAWER